MEVEFEMMEQRSLTNERVRALEEALKDPDEGVRRKAAESLSRIEVKADLGHYIRMLDSDDRATRIQAIYLLGKLDAEEAIELLRLQMADPYDDVRAAVVQALGDSQNSYEASEIREKAVDIVLMGLQDASPAIRSSAANALARFVDPRSVAALSRVIACAIGDEIEDIQVVISALFALGEIGDRKVVPEVIEAARTDNLEVREAALKVLGMIGDSRAEACLIEALTNDIARIRMQAAQSLGKI